MEWRLFECFEIRKSDSFYRKKEKDVYLIRAVMERNEDAPHKPKRYCILDEGNFRL
jgi:hypothetical protein